MVKIRQEEFNKELGSYLKEREQAKPTDFLINLKKRDKKVDEEVPEMDGADQVLVEEKEPSFFERLFRRRAHKIEEEIEEAVEEDAAPEEMEVEYEQLDEIEEQIEDKKERLFQKLINLLRARTFQDEAEETTEAQDDYEEYAVPDDLKKVLRIVNDELKNLPPSKLTKFKNSGDYVFYKETLRKYKLIK